MWLERALIQSKRKKHQMTAAVLRTRVQWETLGGFMANCCTLTNLMNNPGVSSAATCASIHDWFKGAIKWHAIHADIRVQGHRQIQSATWLWIKDTDFHQFSNIVFAFHLKLSRMSHVFVKAKRLAHHVVTVWSGICFQFKIWAFSLLVSRVETDAGPKSKWWKQ